MKKTDDCFLVGVEYDAGVRTLVPRSGFISVWKHENNQLVLEIQSAAKSHNDKHVAAVEVLNNVSGMFEFGSVVRALAWLNDEFDLDSPIKLQAADGK